MSWKGSKIIKILTYAFFGQCRIRVAFDYDTHRFQSLAIHDQPHWSACRALSPIRWQSNSGRVHHSSGGKSYGHAQGSRFLPAGN